MSAVNTRAALGALLGVRSAFVRTPKFGGRSDSKADPDASRGFPGLPVGSVELMISGVLLACLFQGLRNDFALIGAPFLLLFAAGFLWVGGARFVESRRREKLRTAVHFRALRWSAAAAIVAVTVVAVLGADSFWRSPPENAFASRVAGVDLADAQWSVRGASVAGTESRRSGLTLDVELDPKSGAREEGEIFIDLTGTLAQLGTSLSDSQELVFDIAFPSNFSGELQAFVSDAEGKSQYGSIAFVERHDVRRRVQVGIAPGSLTPAMGYTDPDFDAQRSIRRVGLKVSAQSDRVRGLSYRPFHGELTVAGVRVVPRQLDPAGDSDRSVRQHLSAAARFVQGFSGSQRGRSSLAVGLRVFRPALSGTTRNSRPDLFDDASARPRIHACLYRRLSHGPYLRRCGRRDGHRAAVRQFSRRARRDCEPPWRHCNVQPHG